MGMRAWQLDIGGRALRILLLAMPFAVIWSSVATAIEVDYVSVDAAQYGDFGRKLVQRDFRIRYDEELKSFSFYLSDGTTTFGFRLSRSEADTLVLKVAKYQKWNRKASEMGVTLEKEIGYVVCNLTAWAIGDDWSYGPKCEMVVQFVSEDSKVHKMAFLFPKLIALRNREETHTCEPIYFGWKSAAALARALDPESVAAWLKQQAELQSKQAVQQAKQKAIEDEFK